ncbi:MAG: hypothetical protein ACI8ZM_002634 [Crocinitomix sp.]|jgi:hypothetical protein
MLWFPFISFACDNCNIYLNLSPNDYKNSIGIFIRHREMYGEYNLVGEMITTRHAGHGNDMAFWGEKVVENYFTYELRGSFFIRERWKTSLVLPLANNLQQIGDDQRYNITGVGDPIIMESFQVFNTKRDTTNKRFSQQLNIGAGLKLPLGKTNLEYENGVPNLDLQPGTGSWDIFAFIAYTAKLKFMGFTTNLNHKRNGLDAEDYRYGATTNGTFNLFGDLTFKRFTLRVEVGTYFEFSKMDETTYFSNELPFQHYDTGGNVWFGNSKIQLFTDHFVAFLEHQSPFNHNLNGYTQLLTKNKINAGITYTF